MKLSDLFNKKKNEKSNFSNFNEMKKEQITKVLGGDGGTTAPPTPVESAIVKSKSNISNN
jgi:hypothetical protein